MKALDYALDIAYKQTAELTAVTILQYLKGRMVPYVPGIYDIKRISDERKAVKASLLLAQNHAKHTVFS